MKSAIFARLVLVSTVLGGMLSANAMAFPRNQVRGKVAFGFQPNVHNFELLDIDFTAIVALSDCSGSLVRFTNSAPTDKAMVLTNGHCHEGSFIQPDDAVSQVRSARRFQLLNSTATATLGTLTATQVIYGTMTGTDMLLYKLDTSYEAIEKKYGVNALTISESRSEAGSPIRIASGYWKRMYSCKIDDFVHKLREDKWTFNDSIRYTQPGCKTIGGTSGSPIVHADSNEVVI